MATHYFLLPVGSGVWVFVGAVYAMRRCETTQDVRPAYSEALRAIKATDAIVVGMYNKEKGQVAANAELVKQVLAELA